MFVQDPAVNTQHIEERGPKRVIVEILREFDPEVIVEILREFDPEVIVKILREFDPEVIVDCSSIMRTLDLIYQSKGYNPWS